MAEQNGRRQQQNLFKCTFYLANSANCFGSLRSMPGKPSGGSFLPVMYSEKSGCSSSCSRSWFLSSTKKQNAHSVSTAKCENPCV